MKELVTSDLKSLALIKDSQQTMRLHTSWLISKSSGCVKKSSHGFKDSHGYSLYERLQ